MIYLLLTSADGGGDHTVGVFSSRENAQSALDKIQKFSPNFDLSIEPCELNVLTSSYDWLSPTLKEKS